MQLSSTMMQEEEIPEQADSPNENDDAFDNDFDREMDEYIESYFRQIDDDIQKQLDEEIQGMIQQQFDEYLTAEREKEFANYYSQEGRKRDETKLTLITTELPETISNATRKPSFADISEQIRCIVGNYRQSSENTEPA